MSVVRFSAMAAVGTLLGISGMGGAGGATSSSREISAARVPVVVQGQTNLGGGSARLLLSSGSIPDPTAAESSRYEEIAKTPVSGTGAYAIPMRDLRSLASRANADGYVNAMVVVPTKSGDDVVDVAIKVENPSSPAIGETIVLDDPTVVRQSTAAQGRSESIGSSVAVGDKGKYGNDLGAPKRVPVKYLDSVDSSIEKATSGPSDVYWCTLNRERWVATRNTFMAGSYSTATGYRIRATATLERSTSSLIGTAGSASGAGLTFRRSGEISKERSTTSEFPAAANTSRHNYSKVSYHRYRRDCYTDTGFHKRSYSIRPYTILGGQYIRNVGAPGGFWKCLNYRNGLVMNRTKAFRSYIGVDLSGIIGTDLHAETGFRKTARLSWNVKPGKVARLCGGGVYPEQSSRQVARNPA